MLSSFLRGGFLVFWDGKRKFLHTLNTLCWLHPKGETQVVCKVIKNIYISIYIFIVIFTSSVHVVLLQEISALSLSHLWQSSAVRASVGFLSQAGSPEAGNGVGLLHLHWGQHFSQIFTELGGMLKISGPLLASCSEHVILIRILRINR